MSTDRNKQQLFRQQKYFRRDFSYYKNYEGSLNAWRQTYLYCLFNDFLNWDFDSEKTVLDIGCGSGYAAIEIAKKKMRVVACDISDHALKLVSDYKDKKRLTNLVVLKADAQEIPLESNSVDYIIANAILEHLVDEKKAIRSWKRILKKGGRIFLTVPLKFRWMWPLFWPINYYYDRVLGHQRRYDLNEMTRKFNLKLIDYRYTGHLVKMIWLLVSRLMMGGIRKSSRYDYWFEKIDAKFNKVAYGGSNLIVIFQK